MKVGVWPADQGGCGHSRLIFPVKALKAQGVDVHIMSGLSGEFVDGPTGPMLRSVLDPGVDVAVLQRPLTAELAGAVPHLQRRGIAVVVEIDDDFRTVPAGNPAFWATHPRAAPEKSRHHLSHAIKFADLVTVSTPYLVRRYGGPEKATLLRNLIPARYLTIGRGLPRGLPAVGPVSAITGSGTSSPLVGWPGSPITHPGDLEVTSGAVARAISRTDARFRAIGGEKTCDVLGIPPHRAEYRPWTKTIHEYPHAVAELDIGIVPLAPTAFNAAKSALKGLEMASLGVAFVASPLPEYRWLHSKGSGILTEGKRGWAQALLRLIEDEVWRRERAETGRAVAAGLTYEMHCDQWMDAWQEAFDRRMRTSINAARRAML